MRSKTYQEMRQVPMITHLRRYRHHDIRDIGTLSYAETEQNITHMRHITFAQRHLYARRDILIIFGIFRQTEYH